jgi:trimethylguanosine synthase
VATTHRVRVYPLPGWLDAPALLGAGPWVVGALPDGLFEACAELPGDAAADLAARLHGLALGGRPVAIEIDPAPSSAARRRGRLAEARRLRDTTPLTARTGLRMDAIGRMSWTPEVLARALGRRAAGRRIVDACCGAGGNAIGFALEGCDVVAIDADASRLELARHNVARCGVADRVQLVHADARAMVGELEAELLFVDPPWDCPDADLPPLFDLLGVADRFPAVWCKLPAGFPVHTLPGGPGAWTVEPVFGRAAGDRQRIKFLWLRRGDR